MTDPYSGPVSKVPIMGTLDRFGLWEVPGLGGLQSGRLVCEKNSKLLTVMAPASLMDDFKKCLDPTLETVPAIRGVIETGEHVLLDMCANVRSRFISSRSEPQAGIDGDDALGGATSIMKKTYMAKTMYVSMAPVPRRPELARTSVSYTSLFTWLNGRTIDTKLGEAGATITFTPPKPRRVGLPGGVSLTLNYGYTISDGVPQKKFVLPQSAAVIFESPSPVEFSWFYPHIMTFANFLMMGATLPVHPETCVMMRGRDEIAVFPRYTTYENHKEEGLFGMRFNYQQIADSFDDAVRCWFGMAQKYEESMSLYFQTRLEGETQSSDIQFLRTARALEALYRAKHPGADKSICSMLKELAHDLPYDVFPGGQAESDFLSNVSDTRNYFSHGFLANKEQAVPKGADFAKMAARAELFLYGCYLHELEIGDELKAEIMKKRSDWVNRLEFF